MPVFPKPKFPFSYDAKNEIRNLRSWKKRRDLPEKTDDSLLVATWNLANFGAQERREKDISLMAEIISWFDLIALQEVRQKLGHFEALLSMLPKQYSAIYTDTAGNNERMVFLYDADKLRRRELVGEVCPYPADLRNIRFQSIKQTFRGFDRNPFIQSFKWSDVEFCAINVHLYYGSNRKSSRDIDRRTLETYAVARWVKMQSKTKYNAEPNIIALGDFNLPYMDPNDAVFRALTKYGLLPTEHSTLIGATLPSEAKARTKQVFQYDQIAFLPQIAKRYTKKTGTFDFDGCIFKELWEKVEKKKRGQAEFNAYVRYYISDHRPLWAKFV